MEKAGPTLGRGIVTLVVANVLLGFLDFDLYERRLNFASRTFLEKDPPFDRRITTFVIDDNTVAALGRKELRLEDWSRLLTRLDSLGPEAIIVPKIFTLVQSVSDDSRQQSITRLEAVRAPIVSTAFPSSRRINSRRLLNPDGWHYRIRNHVGEDITAAEIMEKLQRVRWIYGATPELRRFLQRPGHAIVDSTTHITPFYGFGQERVLPHFTLSGAEWTFRQNHFELDGNRVPLTPSWKIPINFHDFGTYSRRTISIGRILNDEAWEKIRGRIAVGGYFYLVPTYYTGGTVFKETPVGMMPVEFLSLPILNSRLTGAWLRPLNFRGQWWYQLMGLGGILVVANLSTIVGVSMSLLAALTIIGAGIFAFSWYGIEAPWLGSAGWLLSTALMTTILRLMKVETSSRHMRRALTGLLPEDQVEKAMKDPTILDLKPQMQTVTIMFIDIVGFSLTTQKISSVEVFDEIRSYLQQITDVVLKWGGVVDKTLGDGMLCFFGYHLGDPDEKENHALSGLHCALEIQNLCYIRNVASARNNRPVLPLRVGVNTAEVIIGNLGGAQRIDISMMGHGVNLASRLETACDPFKIMVGADCRRFLGDEGEAFRMVGRKIQIKHFSELTEAWELNPYDRTPAKLHELKRLYWAWTEDQIAMERYAVNDGVNLWLRLQGETFRLLNYSLNGYLVEGPLYLGSGVTLDAHIDSDDGSLNRFLTGANLSPFMIEVRSGQVLGDGRYHLGISIPGLNQNQKTRILDALQKANIRIGSA